MAVVKLVKDIFCLRLAQYTNQNICIIDNCKDYVGWNLYDSFFDIFLIFDNTVSEFLVKDDMFFICPGDFSSSISIVEKVFFKKCVLINVDSKIENNFKLSKAIDKYIYSLPRFLNLEFYLITTITSTIIENKRLNYNVLNRYDIIDKFSLTITNRKTYKINWK